ncbi:hypothetical protein [Jeotgalibacillus campisalis]|uniref:Endolytic transglycosylase MltG n=1 Tax=Jeotgalibacillus campisalis TaxID=220754 RepID=A0A0C2R6Z7_9BACL|nr:hypothetical protein [Jeotgalibacillus campisalis]KIL45995.1 hypothetical protein KR50_26700 [Jeotgalibacillus campisalis]
MFAASMYFSDEDQQTTASSDTESADTVTLTKEEHDSLNAQIKEWENRVIELSASKNESQSSDGSGTSGVTTRFILTIEPGMTSPEISEELEEFDIIEEAALLDDYLKDQQLTEKIQIGKYDVNSSLSIEEIAALITK